MIFKFCLLALIFDKKKKDFFSLQIDVFKKVFFLIENPTQNYKSYERYFF